MSGSFGYHCRTCGEYHDGIPSFGWDQPMEYWQVPEEERATRVDLCSDACVIDGKWFFVRGYIELEPTDHPLGVDQRDGISPSRMQEIATRLLHPEQIE